MFTAKLGGKISQQTTASSRDISNSGVSDMTSSASLSMGYNFMKLDASQSTAQQALLAESKTSKFTLKKARFMGGIPSTSWEEWCASTAAKPVPLSYKMRTVASLASAITGDMKLAREMESFLQRLAKNMHACTSANSGKVYDRFTGKCEEGGTCEAGSIKKGDTCEDCPVGKYQRPGASSCRTCMIGTYTDKAGTPDACTLCPRGRTSPEGWTTERCPEPMVNCTVTIGKLFTKVFKDTYYTNYNEDDYDDCDGLVKVSEGCKQLTIYDNDGHSSSDEE